MPQKTTARASIQKERPARSAPPAGQPSAAAPPLPSPSREETLLARRALSLKKRLIKDRDALAALTQKGLSGAPDALVALLDLTALMLGEARQLARHPLTVASPLGPTVATTLREMQAQQTALAQAVVKSALGLSMATAAGEATALLQTLEKLVVRQLALLHRPAQADYFHGQDAQSTFGAYRCSAANRGRVAALPRQPVAGAKPWRTSIGGLIWPTAITDAAGNLYTGHAEGEFVALGPDGKVKWRLRDKQMMYIDSTSALGRDGFLYMASTDMDPRGNQNQGRIWKVDPATGKVLWTFWGRHFEDPEHNPKAHLSSFFEGNLALGWEDGRVVVYGGSDDNHLYKLSDRGELLWEYHADAYPAGVIWTKPLLSPDGQTVFLGDLSGLLHAVNTATGQARWRRRLGGSVVSSPAWGLHGELFLGCFDGNVYALAPEDGEEYWRYQTMGLIYSSPAITQRGDVVIGSGDGGVYCLNRFGQRQWVYYTGAPVKSSPAIGPDGLVYVGSQNGKLYALRPDGRRLWSYNVSPPEGQNDINCSPSLGPDGTVVFGDAAGAVHGVPRDAWFEQRADQRFELSPADDGKRPDIPPGGAALVFMDTNGTACFEPPAELSPASPLNLMLFAVDGEMNVIPAELVAPTVQVTLRPHQPFAARVESMGRYLYVVTEDFLKPDTAYTLTVKGRYRAGDEERELASHVTLRTARAQKSTGPGLPVGKAVVVHSARICRPKEIDALGQAMLDSMNFALAPVWEEKATGRFVGVFAAVTASGGAFHHTPTPVNRTVGLGCRRGDDFIFTGPLHLIAQGANIPVQKFRLAGRFDKNGGVDQGSLQIIAPVGGMPDFAELVRVMRLADQHDDVVGFCSYTATVFHSPALSPPKNLKVQHRVTAGSLTVTAQAPGLRAQDHWLSVVVFNPATGAVRHTGQQAVQQTAPGTLTLTTPAPQKGEQALLVVDLWAKAL